MNMYRVLVTRCCLKCQYTEKQNIDKEKKQTKIKKEIKLTNNKSVNSKIAKQKKQLKYATDLQMLNNFQSSHTFFNTALKIFSIFYKHKNR